MRAKEFMPESQIGTKGFGIGEPRTYEQEYSPFIKNGGQKRLVSMTEEENETITLSKLYGNEVPDRDELFWNFVDNSMFKVPFEIQIISPTKLSLYLTHQYDQETIGDVRNMLDSDQKAIVKHYMNDSNLSNEIIVIYDGMVIDGNHRALAAVLSRRPIKYIDVSEEPESLNEINHASNTQAFLWNPEFKKKAEVIGQTQGFDIWCLTDGDKKICMFLGQDDTLEAYVALKRSPNFPEHLNICQIENVSGKPGLATTLMLGIRDLGVKFVIDYDEPLNGAGLKWVANLIKSKTKAFRVTDQNGNLIDINNLTRERLDAFENEQHGPTAILIEFSETTRNKLQESKQEWLHPTTIMRPRYVFYGNGRLW